MSKADDFETEILALIFNATAIADLAQNDGSSPATTLTVALHTADPGDDGDQTTNETAYTGYARVEVDRDSGGWTVSGGSVSPAANIDFPECSGSPGGDITHFSVGTGVSDKILYSGTVSPNIDVEVGTVPRLTTATAITEA
jgi:hypothetical protein